MLLLLESIFLFMLVLCTCLVGAKGPPPKFVVLESIEIFASTHNWLPVKPTVYFQCLGETPIVLPDVKVTNFSYNFKGKESWQPLTELHNNKCKRCGIYELDIIIKPNKELDVWEFCLDDFHNGTYQHFKESRFNATFVYFNDTSEFSSKRSSYVSKEMERANIVPLAALVCMAVILMVAVALMAALKYWERRKRAQDLALFMKMFEEGHNVEDELDMKH